MDHLVTLGEIKVYASPKKVRCINFRVNTENGRVSVSYPKRMSFSEVEKEIFGKRQWIENAYGKYLRQKNSEDDGCVYLSGKKYKLVVNERQSVRRVGISADEVNIDLKGTRGEELGIALRALYTRTLEGRLPVLIAECEDACGMRADSWALRDMKTRWGSCTPKTGKIRLSISLARFDDECVKSVVYHELCHLAYPDHSDAFYKLLYSFCPGYKELKKRMNERRFSL